MTEEVWRCHQCAWVGHRYNCDSHLRANFNHGVYPVSPTRDCPNCGTRINARSLWCHGCRQAVTPEAAA